MHFVYLNLHGTCFRAASLGTEALTGKCACLGSSDQEDFFDYCYQTQVLTNGSSLRFSIRKRHFSTFLACCRSLAHALLDKQQVRFLQMPLSVVLYGPSG